MRPEPQRVALRRHELITKEPELQQQMLEHRALRPLSVAEQPTRHERPCKLLGSIVKEREGGRTSFHPVEPEEYIASFEEVNTPVDPVALHRKPNRLPATCRARGL